MKELKQPKKPLIYYYCIAILILVLFNLIAIPAILQNQVVEVDYGTFMKMTDEGNIGRVEVEENQIVFTDKEDETIYCTGLMDDSGLTERLYTSGAKFSKEIIKQMSPLLSFLLSWLLPIAIFIGIGQFMSRQLMKRAGGDSMMFNLGSPAHIIRIHPAIHGIGVKQDRNLS